VMTCTARHSGVVGEFWLGMSRISTLSGTGCAFALHWSVRLQNNRQEILIAYIPNANSLLCKHGRFVGISEKT